MRGLAVGTRASKLSLAQTAIVTGMLSQRYPGLPLTVVPVTTRGDTLPPERRGTVDGKTAFTGEIESMLIDGEVDIAVHSMKDLPSKMDERLVIGATPPRGDPRDVLLSKSGKQFSELPPGATVGTSSLRRRAQLLRMRRDLSVVELHGNIETRMRRVDEGLDAAVLAAAGVRRLGADDRIAQYFTIEEVVPAVGQGILAVQSRRGDEEVARILASIDDRRARLEATCERSFSQRMGGDCNVPVGGNASLSEDSISIVGLVASQDGNVVVTKTIRGRAREAEVLGRTLAEELLEMGGELMLEGQG